jgi:hypothetical protein
MIHVGAPTLSAPARIFAPQHTVKQRLKPSQGPLQSGGCQSCHVSI